jgi:hypothetical protein
MNLLEIFKYEIIQNIISVNYVKGDTMGFNSELMLKPMLIGGIVCGIIAGIPVINCLNCCCLMYIASGAIAAYLILKKAPVSMNDIALAGAGSGFIAGLIGGILNFVFSLVINTTSAGIMGDDMMESIMGSTIGGVIGIPVAIIFGTIAGAIGAIVYLKINER